MVGGVQVNPDASVFEVPVSTGDLAANSARIRELSARIDSLDAGIAALVSQQAEIAKMLATVVDNVKPALDAMSNSPIGRMMGLKS